MKCEKRGSKSDHVQGEHNTKGDVVSENAGEKCK